MIDDTLILNSDSLESTEVSTESTDSSSSSSESVTSSNSSLLEQNSITLLSSTPASSVNSLSSLASYGPELLEGNYDVSDLLKATDNPGIWALGIAILNNIVSKNTLEADEEAIMFSQLTSKEVRQRIIDENEKTITLLNSLIKEHGSAYRSGINRSGKISPTPRKRKW